MSSIADHASLLFRVKKEKILGDFTQLTCEKYKNLINKLIKIKCYNSLKSVRSLSYVCIYQANKILLYYYVDVSTSYNSKFWLLAHGEKFF